MDGESAHITLVTPVTGAHWRATAHAWRRVRHRNRRQSFREFTQAGFNTLNIPVSCPASRGESAWISANWGVNGIRRVLRRLPSRPAGHRARRAIRRKPTVRTDSGELANPASHLEVHGVPSAEHRRPRHRHVPTRARPDQRRGRRGGRRRPRLDRAPRPPSPPRPVPVTIGIRHSRHRLTMGRLRTDLPVLDYRTHQDALYGVLAEVYACSFLVARIKHSTYDSAAPPRTSPRRTARCGRPGPVDRQPAP